MNDVPIRSTSNVRVARDPYPATPRVVKASKRAIKAGKRDVVKIKKELGAESSS